MPTDKNTWTNGKPLGNPLYRSDPAQALVSIDVNLERRLLRKLDFTLLPFFMLLLGINFFGRSSLGNAKIAGLEHDLGMKGYDFNIAITVLSIGALISDMPFILMQQRFGSEWIGIRVTSTGVITFTLAFVHTFPQLVTILTLRGLAEGGLLSGLMYALTKYYRRRELVLRAGIFMGIAPTLAGAFGGLLASGLLTLDDFGQVRSWRKIFFVEGIISTGVGILSFLVIPSDPRKSKLLTKEERALVIARLDADAVIKTDGHTEKASLQLIKHSFSIWVWICAICYLMLSISYQGLTGFLPTVIKGLGKFSTIEVQLRTVPPFVVASLWALVFSYWSFKYETRGIPAILSMLSSAIGYAIAIGTKNSRARYAACFLSVGGGHTGLVLFFPWVIANSAPDTMRAVTSACLSIVGTLGTIIAFWTYLPNDAPSFYKGNSLHLAASGAVVALTIFGLIYLRWENAKRERGERDERIQGLDHNAQYKLGYKHPQFRYQV